MLLPMRLLGFFFLVVVNGNGLEVLLFKNLIAIQAADIIYAISTVEEFDSLVLATLHSGN
ncbi:MAG TPA: hypothetical protein VLJ11_19090 [Bryobacteraceae bacterium]|nr:hypothetical protein [Bryobacteraceae bacterium]